MATTDARNNKSLLRAFETLGNTQTVGDFLDSVPDLSVADGRLIVDQAMVLIDQLYAHLPLKRARLNARRASVRNCRVLAGPSGSCNES